MIPAEDRKKAIELIDEAVSNGARRFKACETLGISVRTTIRWKDNSAGDKRKGASKSVPRKLSEEEQQEILNVWAHLKTTHFH